MKLLIINFEYPPLGGGGGTATRDLAHELAKRHEVYVLTTHFKGLPYEEVCNNVAIHRVAVIGRNQLPISTIVSLLTFFPAALWRGITLGFKEKFDVVNAQFVLPSGLPALVLSWLWRVPLVVSFIGGDIYDPSKGISPHRSVLFRWLIRFISSQATAMTAISQDTKNRAIKLHGVRGEIKITPLGIYAPTQQVTTRAELGLPADALVAVSIGRLVTRKRFDLLLQAWQNIPDAHLVIIGDGPLKESLLSMRYTYNLQDRVHIVGFVSEQMKQAYLQRSDMYVSTAEHEGFGIVFLEAMAVGLPIIAMNDGGQMDFLTEQENALLVPPNNKKALLEALRTLCNDKALRQKISEQNHLKVKNFLWPIVAERFEQIVVRAAKKRA